MQARISARYQRALLYPWRIHWLIAILTSYEPRSSGKMTFEFFLMLIRIPSTCYMFCKLSTDGCKKLSVIRKYSSSWAIFAPYQDTVVRTYLTSLLVQTSRLHLYTSLPALWHCSRSFFITPVFFHYTCRIRLFCTNATVYFHPIFG